MAQGKTTVYRLDKEGNISKIRVLKEKDREVHLWKRGARINYSVSHSRVLSVNGSEDTLHP